MSRPSSQPRHRHGGRREGREVRQADQVRRPARRSVRLVHRRRRQAPGQGHPPGEQYDADPDASMPSEEDLHVRVTAAGSSVPGSPVEPSLASCAPADEEPPGHADGQHRRHEQRRGRRQGDGQDQAAEKTQHIEPARRMPWTAGQCEGRGVGHGVIDQHPEAGKSDHGHHVGAQQQDDDGSGDGQLRSNGTVRARPTWPAGRAGPVPAPWPGWSCPAR